MKTAVPILEGFAVKPMPQESVVEAATMLLIQLDDAFASLQKTRAQGQYVKLEDVHDIFLDMRNSIRSLLPSA